MSHITGSVGHQASNRLPDVKVVQGLLNQYAGRLAAPPLAVDGKVGQRTVEAIRLFQSRIAGLAAPDGRVDPGGRTWMTLASCTRTAAQLSGSAWWQANQARFPNSTEVSALDPAFRLKVDKFLAAMKAAGLKVHVRSTRRNKVRAYLMHYSWKVAKGAVHPSKVPAEPGCAIVWDHANDAASRAAAKQMVDLFGLVYQPALNSRHIPGLAIDMDIQWGGMPRIKDSHGHDVALGAPGDGAVNAKLHAVGASYGVVKNVLDRPHWSDTGR